MSHVDGITFPQVLFLTIISAYLYLPITSKTIGIYKKQSKNN